MNKSVFTAITIVVLLVAWMLSGVLGDDGEKSQPDVEESSSEIFSVAVELRQAQLTDVVLRVQGQTVPNRSVQMKAQTEGLVQEIYIDDGQPVIAGQAVLKIDLEDRQLRLEQASALLEAREKRLTRLNALNQQQYQAENEIEVARADVKASQTEVARITVDIMRTQPKSPFAGTVQRVHMEQGDFAREGDVLAEILDLDPLIAEVRVGQQNVKNISVGGKARVTLATGEIVNGEIRYIAPRAEADSRTFVTEVAIDNPDGKLKSGTSATVELITNTQKAHYISPALFSLADDGTIGVKTVDDSDRVQFYEISMLQSDADGVWVTGLPETVKLIVSGQGFVQAGTQVLPVEAQTRG